jgi:hypothetical protein
MPSILGHQAMFLRHAFHTLRSMTSSQLDLRTALESTLYIGRADVLPWRRWEHRSWFQNPMTMNATGHRKPLEQI